MEYFRVNDKNKFNVSSYSVEYRKKYYEEQKEKYLLRSKLQEKEKWKCEVCNVEVVNKSLHKKMKKHIKNST
jgi:hypothetical protein